MINSFLRVFVHHNLQVTDPVQVKKIGEEKLNYRNVQVIKLRNNTTTVKKIQFGPVGANVKTFQGVIILILLVPAYVFQKVNGGAGDR